MCYCNGNALVFTPYRMLTYFYRSYKKCSKLKLYAKLLRKSTHVYYVRVPLLAYPLLLKVGVLTPQLGE